MEMNFLELGICKELELILKQNGITQPTPIQEQVIPVLLSGKDVIAQAQTGTGKTLAFILPMIERIDVSKQFVQALIITPTRELALQITNEAKKYMTGNGINILTAYGGQDVEQQIRKLKGTVHVVIGTPGRLLDHIGRKTVSFSKTGMLVLDEADEMLNMGFLKDVEQIIHQTSQKRQTMLFSATMPKGIHVLASKYMDEPVRLHVQSNNITLDEIKQLVIETTDRSKQDALCSVIKEANPFMALIFCRTKRRVTALFQALKSRGYNVDELHGDLSQAKREKAMKSFRKAELQFLIATDVAARGLDIEGITHVFNYDIPLDAESYIHRIGRTGRAGQKGVAITFVTHRDREELHEIEKAIKIKIDKKKIVTELGHVNVGPTNETKKPRNSGFTKYRGSDRGRDQRFGNGKKFGTRQSSRNKPGGRK